MATVLSVGAAVLDMVLAVEELPAGGEKFEAADLTLVGGGGAANAAVTVARLGGRALLAARLGEDAIGAMIMHELRDNGVDCSLVRQSADARSSCSSICVDSAGERQIVNFRGAGLIASADWLPALIPECDVLLADTRWPEAAITVMQLARERGVPGVLDAESPMEPSLAAIGLASHVAFSAEGLRSYSGCERLEDGLLEAAGRCGAPVVAVTDGGDGVYWIDRGVVSHEPAMPVDAVDTLGAGDTWHGAYALALAEGLAGRPAFRFANIAAALKCRRTGRKGIPTRREVDALFEQPGE